ncbi:uncharacterized protein LOC120127766 [Hibiscus syriacus]|uniref:uncharacterized protein LOC120127766 n=1 Tax=Hibiscus syriacus TaxID=106335 RepID=UPI00192077D2|nr:uncharacterized protein LOC120127766 [Hibiscus syriacus]
MNAGTETETIMTRGPIKEPDISGLAQKPNVVIEGSTGPTMEEFSLVRDKLHSKKNVIEYDRILTKKDQPLMIRGSTLFQSSRHVTQVLSIKSLPNSLLSWGLNEKKNKDRTPVCSAKVSGNPEDPLEQEIQECKVEEKGIKEIFHALSRNGPSETLKIKVAEVGKTRKRRNTRKDQLFVEVPESRSFLDTVTLSMVLSAVAGIAVFAKLLMMHDESRSQEMIEQKIKNAPPGQGAVRMLTREEWEEIREVRPRTPFESELARPNAKTRTKNRLEDWTIDVLTDAVTRAENCLKYR